MTDTENCTKVNSPEIKETSDAQLELEASVEPNQMTPSVTEETQTQKSKSRVLRKKKNGSLLTKKEKYSCPLCSKEFQNKSGRYNHIRLHHKMKLDFGKVHCLEAGCLFSCTYTTVLQQHLTGVHNIPMEFLNLEFDNYEGFEKWKHNFETTEVCRFVKKSGSRVGDSGKSMYLYCSRSGTFVSQGQGRRFKKLGSAKISAHCTALIKYFEESSGKVKATVCSTHYGHDRDHRFLRLTKFQKTNIAEKMKSGMSRELVLDSIRSTFVNKLDRIHELSKKDLNNIQKSYKIPKQQSETRKSNVNNSSVLNPLSILYDCWTDEINLSTDSPVLLYKEMNGDIKNMKSGIQCPASTIANEEYKYLKPEDKCLILMTEGQRDLFFKFCNKGILYVTILRLSFTLSLFLIVIFVLDDFYEMFPVCFMVANDNRADMLKVCFNEILKSIGPIPLRAFATDNQSHIFDAWCDVMGPTTSPIIANRYVDAEWRNNLTIVENEALQGEIYDKLYDFIENADGNEKKFESLIGELHSSRMASAFATYLEKNFLHNIRSWSTHYLKELHNLRESIDFEISYSKISSLREICCKYNKSIGYAAKGLIKLLLDLQSNRNRKVAEHVVDINTAHAASIECGVECVFPLTSNSWKVRSGSKSENFCEVVADQCDFENCVLVCTQCEMCIHAFRCMCESYIDSKTCVHVHLVGILLRNNSANVCQNKGDQMLCGTEDRNELPDIDECLENSNLCPSKFESLRILDDIRKKINGIQDENCLNRLHELIKDMKCNVDVLLNHGGHAKKVQLVKSSKLVKRKTMKRACTTKTKRKR